MGRTLREGGEAARLPRGRALAALQRSLCRWFAAEQRDLPWRRRRDPYAVWISEAMLQQTRVETVLPYYRRFLARFPTLAALASAREDQVLALWSGLGYYSRARALLEAARAIRDRHGGRWPRTREEWLELPGVGPYTAGAVLSIAFGLPEPLVDGNVQRVLARLFALDHPVGSAALRARTWELARALVPGRCWRPGKGGIHPGQWNQALMELGARVCTGRGPRCAVCPLRSRCAARAQDRVDELPRRAPGKKSVDVRLEVFIVARGEKLLLVRRPPGARMAGLWELPTRELAPARRGRDVVGLWPSEFPRGVALEAREPLGELRHAITHHRIQATVRRGRWTRGRSPLGGSLRWAGERELERLGVTGLTKKALAAARAPAAGAARAT